MREVDIGSLGPPDDFTLGHVVSVVEGPTPLAAREGQSELAFALNRVFSAAKEAERDQLDRVSLADLIERASADQETMYYI